NGDPGRRVPNIANLNCEHVEGEVLQISLDLKGVAASTGSACASGSTEPSHVLMAIGLPRDSGYGSLRFSFGKYNTKEDVDYVLEILPAVVEKLRRLSPAKKKKQTAASDARSVWIIFFFPKDEAGKNLNPDFGNPFRCLS